MSWTIVNVVDINLQKLKWNSDLTKLPVFEPGLDKIVQKCRGKFILLTEVEKNISIVDVIFISVTTPTKTIGLGKGMQAI